MFSNVSRKGDVEVAARHNRLIILAQDIFFYYFSSSNEETFTSTSFPLTFDLISTAQEVEPLERAAWKEGGQERNVEPKNITN